MDDLTEEFGMSKNMNPLKMTELHLTPMICFSTILMMLLEGAITEKGSTKL